MWVINVIDIVISFMCKTSVKWPLKGCAIQTHPMISGWCCQVECVCVCVKDPRLSLCSFFIRIRFIRQRWKHKEFDSFLCLCQQTSTLTGAQQESTTSPWFVNIGYFHLLSNQNTTSLSIFYSWTILLLDLRSWEREKRTNVTKAVWS